MKELIPEKISARTIKKAYTLYGIKNTDDAVSCIYTWYDNFYKNCFQRHTKDEVKLVKCVIYLLMTNGYDGSHKKEYLDFMAKN